MSSSTSDIDILDGFELPTRTEHLASANRSFSQTSSDREDSVLFTGREGSENKTSNPKPNRPGPDPESPLQCPKCGAEKVAKSRSYGIDGLVMRLIPKRPFRCMRCYHRFWAKEAFSADPKRVQSWLLIVLIILLALFLMWQMQDSSTQSKSTVKPTQSKEVGEPKNSNTIAAENAPSSNTQGTTEQAGLQAGLIEGSTQNSQNGTVVNRAPLSKDEEQKLLAELAKLEADLPINRPAPPVGATQEERLAIIRVEISHRLEQWRRTWESGNLANYLAFYSPNFTMADGRGINTWRAHRQQQVSPDREIQVQLSEFQVDIDPTSQQATVQFNQYYQAKDYLEQTRKELRLNKTDDQWYITAEREITSQ